MAQRSDVERYRENRQDEIDSAAQYGAMAASEPDPKIAKVYSNLAKMEEAHIAFWEDRLRSAGETVGERRPSWRSRVIAWIILAWAAGHSPLGSCRSRRVSGN
jgi:vacuolar iron transporter family protein